LKEYELNACEVNIEIFAVIMRLV